MKLHHSILFWNNSKPVRKIYLPAVFYIFVSLHLTAQTLSVHHPQLSWLFEDSLIKQPSWHSALKPVEITSDHYNSVMGTKHPLYFLLSNFPLRIAPVLEATAGYNSLNGDWLTRFGQGMYLSGNIGRKAGFELSAILYEEKFPKAISSGIDSLSLIPGYNRYLWKNKEVTGYADIRGKIYWKPLHWLKFSLGNDKQFIGDGYRSLFLSENAAAYPYFQTRLNIWKINYQHQVMWLRDMVPGLGNKRFTKYSSQHTISFNATKNLNVYIFEAVVWRKQDSTRYRGFDLNYLNPFLFFRPVEYNMGSPDNVLMGIGGKWLFHKNSMIYGQLMLDEFRIQELKANQGWWGNKYAYQVGFKTFGLLKKHKSELIAEYNHCRPYTYSHTYSLQNYGYLFYPLAHPLGANFRETVVSFNTLLQNHWYISVTGIAQWFGTDPPGINLGSDIYKPQWSHASNNGNFTGQGVKNELYSGSLSVSKMIIPAWRLRAFLTTQLGFQKISGTSEFISGIQCGINTLLYE